MTDATSGDPTEVLSDATKVLTDPVGVLFGLESEFRVLCVQRIGPTTVKMIIEQIAREGPCPGCGVLSSAVKDRPLIRVKDLPASGQTVELWWRKRRLWCGERLCPRRSFTQTAAAVRPRGRITERLRDKIATAIAGSNRSVADVADEHGVSWPTAHKALVAAAARWLPEPQPTAVLGIDETRLWVGPLDSRRDQLETLRPVADQLRGLQARPPRRTAWAGSRAHRRLRKELAG